MIKVQFKFFLMLIGFGFYLGTAHIASASTSDCSRLANSLPNPTVATGTENTTNPIKHIVVLMQENHSFDNYFGKLNDPQFYGDQVDGIQPGFSNFDSNHHEIKVHPEANLCVADPAHEWNAVHTDWNSGKLDGFVRTNDTNHQGARIMGYYNSKDIPFYYELANQFSIGDRYFCSVLSQTFPNRFYLMAGTSFGHIKNDKPRSVTQFAQKTIFDVLDQYKISWRYYSDTNGYLLLFQNLYHRDLATHIKKMRDYENDLAKDTLPAVVFIDSEPEVQDEHPNENIQIGQAFVAKVAKNLMNSNAWKSSVLFLTYDENGGFYDHVNPPEACAPDTIAPMLVRHSEPGDFAHLGFRVPFIAVSPYAKHHFVSHRTYDHASILKFIETKFNLPALTLRDANADGFSDVFDFAHPVFEVKTLPSGEPDPTRSCN